MSKLTASVLFLMLLGGCGHRADPLPGLPRVFVWAWERREDISWLRDRGVGVAFLARTVWLRADGVFIRPRMQPLRVAPETRLMAVVRVESGGQGAHADVSQAAKAIVEGADAAGVRALQVDFDAVKSERDFYRALLTEVRHRLPAQMPLSITALASWCDSDGWIAGLPVAEAVPMLFRMGQDRYRPGSDFSNGLCRSSIGVSTDELPARIPSGRRVYVFNPRAWSESDLNAAVRKVGQWQRVF